VQNPKLRYFKPFELFDHTRSVGRREEQDSATLVERHSRFLMLIKVPGKETEAAVAALRAMSKNPRRSLQ